MKLIDLLRYMDHLTKITIYTDDEPEDAVFEGDVMDTPYYLLDCKLYKRDEGDDWEGIRAYKKDDNVGLVIYVHA